MRVVITGSSGFVGLNLQKYLADEYQTQNLSIRYVADQSITFDSDAVIHLAGKAHDLKKNTDSQKYYEANYKLTMQVFDAFLTSNASIFIFLSTVKAVADSVDGVLTEESLPNPKTHYGISKHYAEDYILSKKLPKNKKVYILRPCMIHGEGNKGNLNLLYNLVSKGLPWPLGSFQNKRSFLSIENLCFVIKELLYNENVASGIYHLCDDKTLSTNELVNLIATTLGKRSKIWNVNTSFIKYTARIGDFLNLPLNTERLSKLTESYIVSNEKIVTALGKSLPISSQTGLIKTFESFRTKIK